MSALTLELYEQDFYAWTEEQAQLIKNKAFEKLDLGNLFEEIKSMGASEKRELGSRLTTLLMHLLKWKYQPTRRSASWEITIKVQRNELGFLFKQNPSLKNPDKLQDTFLHSYSISILEAAKETKLSQNAFPENCEWTLAQILEDKFYPN